MCCCGSKIAKCMVTTFSIGTILGGLSVIGLGLFLIYNTDSLIGSQPSDEETMTLGELAKQIVMASYIVGAVAVLFGMLGVLVAYTQKTIGICLFGFLSFFLAITMGIASYVVIQLYMVEPQSIKDFCEGTLTETNGPVESLLARSKEYIDKIDDGLQNSIDKHMCKETCPCVELDTNKWESWFQVILSQENGEYRINDPDGYKSFNDCYEDRKVLWQSQPNYEPIDEDALSMQKQLEDLQCAGICRSPLFWAYKDVTEGQPADPCIYTLKAEFDVSAGYMGYVLIFTAITILGIFLFHFGLYLNDEEVHRRSIKKKKFIFD